MDHVKRFKLLLLPLLLMNQQLIHYYFALLCVISIVTQLKDQHQY